MQEGEKKKKEKQKNMAGAEERELQELERAVVQIQALKRHLQMMIEILSSIVDELCFDVCADIHRAHLMRMLALQDLPGHPANRVVVSAGFDIHGQIPEKVPRNENFNCDHCHQKVAAARYTEHLSKCMLNRGRAGRAVRNREANSYADSYPFTAGGAPACGSSPARQHSPTMPAGQATTPAGAAAGTSGTHNNGAAARRPCSPSLNDTQAARQLHSPTIASTSARAPTGSPLPLQRDQLARDGSGGVPISRDIAGGSPMQHAAQTHTSSSPLQVQQPQPVASSASNACENDKSHVMELT